MKDDLTIAKIKSIIEFIKNDKTEKDISIKELSKDEIIILERLIEKEENLRIIFHNEKIIIKTKYDFSHLPLYLPKFLENEENFAFFLTSHYKASNARRKKKMAILFDIDEYKKYFYIPLFIDKINLRDFHVSQIENNIFAIIRNGDDEIIEDFKSFPIETFLKLKN